MQMLSQRLQSLHGVKRGVSWVEPMLGRMIDVQENHMKSGSRGFCMESRQRIFRERKEISLHIACPRISGEPCAERYHTALMPPDHRLQIIHDGEGSHSRISIPHIS